MVYRGEVAEWLKAPLSKSGILAKTGIVGSNPTLSAIFFNNLKCRIG